MRRLYLLGAIGVFLAATCTVTAQEEATGRSPGRGYHGGRSGVGSDEGAMRSGWSQAWQMGMMFSTDVETRSTLLFPGEPDIGPAALSLGVAPMGLPFHVMHHVIGDQHRGDDTHGGADHADHHVTDHAHHADHHAQADHHVQGDHHADGDHHAVDHADHPPVLARVLVRRMIAVAPLKRLISVPRPEMAPVEAEPQRARAEAATATAQPAPTASPSIAPPPVAARPGRPVPRRLGPGRPGPGLPARLF